MSRNRLVIISAGVGLIMLLVLVVVIFSWRRQPMADVADTKDQQQTNSPTTNTTTTITTNSNQATTNSTTPVTIDRDDRQAITSTVTSFTGRFGSYSTDTHFENIERSRYLMTAAMSKQADQIIAAGLSENGFSSVETMVTTVTITDFSAGASGATVEVAGRQTKRMGQGSVEYNNVTARITLKKVEATWLVDSFRWL